VSKGEFPVNKKQVKALNLEEFENDTENLRIEAQSYRILLFGHAVPLNEPVVTGGAFEMNSMDEINQVFKIMRPGNLRSGRNRLMPFFQNFYDIL